MTCRFRFFPLCVSLQLFRLRGASNRSVRAPRCVIDQRDRFLAMKILEESKDSPPLFSAPNPLIPSYPSNCEPCCHFWSPSRILSRFTFNRFIRKCAIPRAVF
ncbi:hypothetical protein CEXT_141651 [Caerostris extrusa]|uniref:Secreted protein n=1 Tax=Caerostris extrusa TaxID=172846 RepID=A0AAV4URQ0_CAEEX|nr:hypothetical protein CEXT_141651 [Caerostris extrusa]